MAQADAFSFLPLELVELIVQNLDLPDARNLRLSGKQLAAMVASTSFRLYYRKVNARLTVECMQQLVAITKQPWVCSVLRDLTITGWIPSCLRGDDLPEGYDRGNLAGLLISALQNFRQITRNKALRSLTLQIDCEVPYRALIMRRETRSICSWQAQWRYAREIALLTAQAVKASCVFVEHLDLFSDTTRCAVQMNCLESILESCSSPGMKSLSMALSTTPDEQLYHEEPTRHAFEVMQSVDGLQKLNLRWYSIRTRDGLKMEHTDRNLLPPLLSSLNMACLEEVTLRGIYTTQTDLQTFIASCPLLTQLSLEEIHLTDGTFGPILAYLDGRQNIELYLSELCEDRLLRFPNPNATSHLPTPSWSFWLRRARGSAETIRYEKPQYRLLSSAAAVNWRQRRALLYGPATWGRD